ncbi:hypothetical protein AVEN_206162-1 [Araneus ventricosus]|uniref:Uncharacterized protein n=1 Tax=Araneus ventricosus TaxID=182803 RepID=A0A4Y2W5U7_ARAVE|nr:hypothetical protein AVEN_206162-1 [Araneus ventricosus]
MEPRVLFMIRHEQRPLFPHKANEHVQRGADKPQDMINLDNCFGPLAAVHSQYVDCQSACGSPGPLRAEPSSGAKY